MLLRLSPALPAAAVAALLAAGAAKAVAAEVAPAACRVAKQAELPLRDQGLMRVTPAINGTPVTMIIDTGAQWTSLTPAAVRRLHLPRDAWHGGPHRGVATFSSNINAIVRRFELGDITLENRSLAVVPLSFAAVTAPPLAGLLGADFLYRFDLDIDLPHRALTLYRNGGCRAGVPGWGGPVMAIPLVKSATNQLTLTAIVDGHPFHAIIDTGATRSLITRPNALRAGVTAEALERDPVILTHGLGSGEVVMRRHVFGELQIGTEHFRHVALIVGGKALGRGNTDMLLGLDFFAGRRVWLSYALRAMFVAAPIAR
jgi:predicted aspartyl protease